MMTNQEFLKLDFPVPDFCVYKDFTDYNNTKGEICSSFIKKITKQ